MYPKHLVFGGETSLRFDDTETYEEYKAEIAEVEMKFYAKERETRGIWASNQGKYVTDPTELNEWDSRMMERRYKKYIAQQQHKEDAP